MSRIRLAQVGYPLGDGRDGTRYCVSCDTFVTLTAFTVAPSEDEEVGELVFNLADIAQGWHLSVGFAEVDKDAIQLLGRWKSDAMLRYLRIQAASHAHNYAQQMLTNGSYTFHPQDYKDCGLPNEASPLVAEIMAHDELYDDA